MFKKVILSLSASVCLLACSTKAGIAVHVSTEQAKTAINLIPAKGLSTVWEGSLSAYTVENGVFYAKQNSSFTDLLYSKKDYENFVLNFKFRFPLKDQKYGANSGIGIRTPRQGEVFFKATDYKRFQPAHASIEVQILEDRHKSYEKLGVMGKNGSFYQIQAPTNAVLKYDGQWNEETIIANGSKLKVILNGVVINEVDLLKAKAVKGYALGMHRTLGRIVICGHGPGVQFKDMSVVELPSSTKTATVAPAGFTTLFNGKDLTNWKGLLHRPYDRPHKRAGLSTDELKTLQAKADKSMKAHWTVNDKGELCFDGKKGGFSLATMKKYKNFEFHCSWKIEKDGDSGIYLRGLPQIQIWSPESKKSQRYGSAKGSGGIWNNPERGKWPLIKADKPVGEWNHFFIRMVGDRVSIWLNDKLTVNDAPLNNLWQEGKPIPEAEQIELQCHGDPVWFKNIFIKELP